MNNKTILVAVSDVFFYTKIRDALLPKGYRLDRARTQSEVSEKAAAIHPIALIVNMNDTGLDAFQAVAQVRAQADNANLPILAFANHEEADTWRRAKELGVTKIVSRNEFSSRTRELFEEILTSQSARATPTHPSPLRGGG
jgi:PleD family two-component response regulator